MERGTNARCYISAVASFDACPFLLVWENAAKETLQGCVLSYHTLYALYIYTYVHTSRAAMAVTTLAKQWL